MIWEENKDPRIRNEEQYIMIVRKIDRLGKKANKTKGQQITHIVWYTELHNQIRNKLRDGNKIKNQRSSLKNNTQEQYITTVRKVARLSK